MKTAIISGGMGGLGSAIGKKLAEDGYNIVLLYLTTPESEASAFLKTLPSGSHEAIHCDIRDGQAVRDVIAGVVERHGSLDAAIHAAVDPIVRKNLLELDGESFKGQFATGVFGGFIFLTAAADAMKGHGGAIIGMLSRALQFSDSRPRMRGYMVAKYALWGLLKELSQELAPFHITVNALAPDFIDTKLSQDIPKAVRDFLAERSVQGSMRSPEDVARAASFLCSEKGKNITGKFFSLDPAEVGDL
jgi:3-oxoacyl-[acyl-carrier protein] reductase